MRFRTPSLCFPVLIFFFLLSACRDAPKLPAVVEDTVVNVRLGADARGLNFLLNYDASALQVMRQISLPLVDFDATTYQMKPLLIKTLPSKKAVTEGKYAGLAAYKYEILEEAVWDDGTPITGKDYQFTIKAIYNPNYASPYPSFFSFLKAVEIDATNPKIFTIYADKYVMAEPVLGNFTLLPAHQLDPKNSYDAFSLEDLRAKENKEKLSTNASLKEVAQLFTSPKNMGQDGEMSGSGPYKLQKWETGQSLTLVKKENWWGDALADKYPMLKAAPKKIVYKIIPDFNAVTSLMRNGEIDLAGSVSADDFKQLEKDAFFKENYNFHAPAMFGHGMVIMNGSLPKLTDKKVRRAIAHLINLEEVFETVYLGEANPVNTLIHPSKPYYHKKLAPITYNIEKAKTLLQEAGWSDSNNNGVVDKQLNGELVELNLKISYFSASKNASNTAQIFKENAKPAGVNIELTPLEGRPLQLGWRQKTFELSIKGSGGYPFNQDPHQQWHTTGASNYFSFGNAESDAVIEEIQQTIEDDKLAALYIKLQEMVYDEQPVIFVNTPTNHIIASKKFGTIRTGAISPGFAVNELALQTVPISINNN